MGILNDERVERAAAARVGHKLAWLWYAKKAAPGWLATGMFIAAGYAVWQFARGHWHLPALPGGGGLHVSPVVYAGAAAGIVLVLGLVRATKARKRGYRIPRRYR